DGEFSRCGPPWVGPAGFHRSAPTPSRARVLGRSLRSRISYSGEGSPVAVLAAEAHAELVESLDQQVRAAVRRDGVDPQRDALVGRRPAEAVGRGPAEVNPD